MPYDIAIIGAARRRQGTGPYVAKKFAALGHRIVGIIGSTLASAESACEQLHQQDQIDTQAYVDFDTLAKDDHPHIVAICSPPETHLDYIQRALEHGCHVFCEKPLWWPLSANPTVDFQQTIADLVTLAEQQQRIIHLNTQWPYTLRYFSQLHPNTNLQASNIHSFSMHLSPESKEVQMLIDSLSHGLSMLYQLLGAGELSNIQFNCAGTPVNSIDLNFDYQHANGATYTQISLKQTMDTPKPAWYQINEFRVDRQVALPDYQIQLQSNSATCTITDPLLLSIKDFTASLDAKLVSDNSALRLGAEHMYTLIQAYTQR